MTSDRPHRMKRSPEAACVELVAGAGTQFDPEITQLLVEEIRGGSGVVDPGVAEAVVEALPLEALRQVGEALGPLAASSVDPLTLLANQRALAQDLRHAAATSDKSVAMLLVQLEDLPRINETAGYEAGDRLIQVAARNAQRMAARYGGTAYRFSGRRLAIAGAPGRRRERRPPARRAAGRVRCRSFGPGHTFRAAPGGAHVRRARARTPLPGRSRLTAASVPSPSSTSSVRSSTSRRVPSQSEVL